MLTAVAILVALILLIGALPIGLAKSWIEQRASNRFGAPATIGSIERTPFFSFSPTVTLHDVRIAQPKWAGSGHWLKAGELRAQIPVWRGVIGGGFAPGSIEARRLDLALVRQADGRSNWEPDEDKPRSGGGSRGGLTSLIISDGRVALRDEKRHLTVSGTLRADAKGGLLIEAAGKFHDAPATLWVQGAPIVSLGSESPYPFSLALKSPLLDLTANGSMEGALNIARMSLIMRARAPSLSYLDDVIEAGLFGTQPIDLTGEVRHRGRDWFIDRLSGRIGRSLLSGKATLLKRDERTKIDGDVRFSQFDFDDLADNAGRAKGQAVEAQIGPRVLPDTRINLAKVGPTDGQIRFRADKLLFDTESAFQTLQGTVMLDHKLLTLDKVRAGLRQGEMTGRVTVDHRSGRPKLHVDLTFSKGSLGTLLNATDMIDAPFRARIDLRGQGDTIREALGKSDGRAGLVAENGTISKLVASVLGQDLGKTIGAAIGSEKTVSLRCAAIGFDARGGLLTASPFFIDTEISVARGYGTIDLGEERIALLISGDTRKSSGLPIVDPINLDGTLSHPAVRVSDLTDSQRGVGSMFKAIGKSIGAALGLEKKKGLAIAEIPPIDCAKLSGQVLAGVPPRSKR